MPIAPADDHTGGPAAASRSRMLTLGVGSALIVSLCYALIAWGEAAADVGDLNRPQSMGTVGGQTALRDYNGLQSGGSTKRATSSSSPTTVPTASPSASARPTACVDSAGWSNGHGNQQADQLDCPPEFPTAAAVAAVRHPPSATRRRGNQFPSDLIGVSSLLSPGNDCTVYSNQYCDGVRLPLATRRLWPATADPNGVF